MIGYLIIVLLATRLADAVLTINPPAVPATIQENSLNGAFVPGSTFSATGQGASALYYYSLTDITPNPGAGNEPFELDQGLPSLTNMADIKVRNPPGLNFESTASWTVEVTVQDLNDPAAGSQSASLTIDITDDPTEVPTFLNLPGTGSVRELVTLPETVKLVSVTDDDNPTNSTGLSFTMTPLSAPFQIGNIDYDIPIPGIAVVTIENIPNPGLNYESGTTTWELIIEAEDIDSQTSTATLTVNVLDENEPMYISNLPDTQVVGEIMNGQIFAVEVIDEDVNATILPTFTITPPVASFDIDALGNVIVVSPGLAGLAPVTYTLTIIATDSGGFTDTQNLMVSVVNTNSGPIVINLPDTEDVPEDTAGGTLVYTLVPFDIDGDAAVCTFAPNPNDGNFEFNSTTNEITLVDPPSLDHDITSSYDVIVICNDGMVVGPAARLTINILPVNKPPQILNLPATVTVPEDAINAAAIMSIEGYDVDGDDLDFTILSVMPSSGYSKFTIADVDSDEADVSIVSNPNFDYEDINQYIIVVEATDGEYTATGTLNVDIVDVNEPPEFVIKPQTLYIDENTPLNTVLYSIILSVNDPDDGPGDLTFLMVPSAEDDHFKISLTNRFKVNTPLDFESDPTTFQVQVSVTDSANNMDYLPINVIVVNVNDEPPVFSEDPYVGQVFENEPGGTSVLTVLATDVEGDNIVYEIDPYSPYVEVDRTTGEVRLKQPLDRRALGSMIQVAVTATDDGSPTTLQDVSYINITIKDVNDNEPVLAQEFYNWEVRYDADIGTYIDRVTATDRDFGNNGAFEFTLLLDNVYFGIDTIGKVSVSDELKAETEYLLYCRAEDSGNPSQTSDISVIRVDTFIPQLVLVNVHLGITVNDFTNAKRTALLNTLNSLFPPWQFRISAVQSEDVTSRRRLLQASNAVLEMYALQDDTTDDIDNVKLHKMFVHASTLVTAMTIDDVGTPSAVLAGTDIVLVEPTYPVEIVVNDINWWLDTLEGNITLGILSFLAFLLLLIPLIICCWKCCCCGRGLSGFCARCCSNMCKRRNVDLEERPADYEMRKKAPEPVIEKKKMDTSDVPEPIEMGPKRPIPRVDDGVPPSSVGKFDFRYAGRPHPGGPQTLKVKDQPTLILTPSSPVAKTADPSLRNAKTTPILQRRGGRVSPVVAGSNDNVGNNIDDENRFDGSAHDNVTGRTYQFNTQNGERKWDISPNTPRRGRGGVDLNV